ncbi:MAG TPA: hypothetical protein VG206_13840 [Terriglobia bacterium]|nr:hypothetical protein [Terriglobia bacterium]
MARLPHALEYREWALAHSPEALRQIANHRWERFVCYFEPALSPRFKEIWRAELFTEGGTPVPKDMHWDEALIREAVFAFVVLMKLSEAIELPVTAFASPYKVLPDHVHLFDLRASLIRQSFAKAAKDSDFLAFSAAVRGYPNFPVPPHEFAAWTRARPMMDLLVPALLFAAIHVEPFRQWIVFNTWTARRAVDPKDRRAALESLQRISDALFPSEWAREEPNPAGLALDYRFIREQADPILQKKYRNQELTRMELRGKLPQFQTSIVDRYAHPPGRKFALGVLATTYGLRPSYVANLLKRGNLFVEIMVHWRKALGQWPPTPPPEQLKPENISKKIN